MYWILLDTVTALSNFFYRSKLDYHDNGIIILLPGYTVLLGGRKKF